MAAATVRSWLVRVAIAAAAVLLSAGGLLYWLTATEPGFRQLMRATQAIPGVAISATQVTGTPARGLAIGCLVIDHERVRIEITMLRVHLMPAFLLGGNVSVPDLDAQAVRVTLKPRRHPPDPSPPVFLPRLLRVTIDRARIAGLVVEDAAGPLFAAQRIATSVVVTSTTIRAAHAALALGALGAGGDATLRSADPLALDGVAAVALPLPAGELVATARVTGDLAQLRIEGALERPARTTFAGTLGLTGPPRLAATLNVDAGDLAPLAHGAPLGRVQATLALNGWLDGFAVGGPVRLGALGGEALEVSFTGDYTHRTLRALRASAVSGPGELEASGVIHFETPTTLALAARWHDLRWPLTGVARLSSARGEATVQGAAPYAFAVDADLLAPGLPPAAVTAAGSLDAERVRVRVPTLRAATMDGRIDAALDAAWDGRAAWSVRATGRALNPGRWRAPLTGRVAFDAQASGEGYGASGAFVASLRTLRGQVRGKAVAGSGTVRRRDGDLTIDQATLHFASLDATANGSLGRQSRLDGELKVGNLGDFLAAGAGSAHLVASYRGEGGSHVLHGSLQAAGLRGAGVAIGALTADADIDTARTADSHVLAHASQVSVGDAHLASAEFAVDGPATRHEIRLTARGGERHAQLLATGRYEPGEQAEHARIAGFEIVAPPFARYELHAPVDLVAAADHAALGEACLDSGESHLCAGGAWHAGGTYHGHLQLSRLDLALLPLDLPAGMALAGAVSLDAAVAAHDGLPPTGQASARLDGVALSYRAAGGGQTGLRIGAGTIDAQAGPERIDLSVRASTTEDSFLSLAASVLREPGLAIGDSPLQGHLALRTRELGGIPILVSGIDRISGLAVADLNLAGSPAHPLVSGSLALSEGAADFYLSNLRLKQVAATATLDGRGLSLDGTAKAGDGSLGVHGTMSWSGGRAAGDLSFKGERLLVADLPEARIVASPDIQLHIAGQAIDVRGEVIVPQARIEPKDLSGAVRASRDEVLTGAGAPPSGPAFTLDSQLKLSLGPDVRIAAYGLRGLLQGSLSVSAKTDELVTGSGDLEVREGHYLAYARELDIERGRLFLRGGPVDNAGLDIRASRRLPGYTAGVNVRGTLQAPQISFFSDPPLPQSQIASLLIVGQTTNDGAAAGSLLAAQGGAFLVGDYAQHFGIDQMTIEADANNGTALVLGKFLSPRLYVSYGVSLAQAINTLKLRYTIGDRWVINTESGLNHSADIQYSFQR